VRDHRLEGTSAFGQLTVALTDRSRLIAGGRASFDHRAADGVDFWVNGNGANRRPRENNGHDGGIDDVRPPTQTMVPEHGAEDQLHIEHKNREQSQRKKGGAALVEFGARLLLDPAAASEYSDADGDAEESLRYGGMRAGDRLTPACLSTGKDRRAPFCKDPASRGVPKPLPRNYRDLSATGVELQGGFERETRCLTRNL